MCGGMLGEAVGGIDKLANSVNPMKGPMQWLTDNTIGKVPGIGKPAGQLYDFSNSHPLESFGVMASMGAGASALGGMGGAADAGAVGAGAADAGSVNLFADGVAGAGGDVGATAGGMAGAGADTAGIGTMAGSGGGASGGSGFMQGLSSLFSSGAGGASGSGGFMQALGGAKGGLGIMQTLSSLYGLEQSRKLSKQASSQSVSNAGLQAVQRSMASQGYQGSGNMMAALSKYGADAYGANLGQQQASLNNNMSSLGLLSAGLGNMAGWGSAPTKPGG